MCAQCLESADNNNQHQGQMWPDGSPWHSSLIWWADQGEGDISPPDVTNHLRSRHQWLKLIHWGNQGRCIILTEIAEMDRYTRGGNKCGHHSILEQKYAACWKYSNLLRFKFRHSILYFVSPRVGSRNWVFHYFKHELMIYKILASSKILQMAGNSFSLDRQWGPPGWILRRSCKVIHTLVPETPGKCCTS